MSNDIYVLFLLIGSKKRTKMT